MPIPPNDPKLLQQLHALWEAKPWTRPRPCGLSSSMGYGDRLGLATPGHIRAHCRVGLEGRVIPVFAQQSGREMERIGRSPAAVMLDAARAVEEADYRHPWGADADHMKSEEQIASCLEAGFTFFTLDPSALIREEAEGWSEERVRSAYVELVRSESSRYQGFVERHSVTLGRESLLAPDEVETTLMRIALVYGAAVHRVAELYNFLMSRWTEPVPFDLEVSVDETSTPTTPLAHRVIARELARLGVRITSLAPRFVGEFQKAVDYIGDLQVFAEQFRIHSEIAREEGPYKVSIHSGSDKFSLYPVIARESLGPIHLKTSGTSYLEALRVVARKAPDLFRKIARKCGEVFEEQRASYHIHATLADLPDLDQVSDGELEARFLAWPDADAVRQILHVCFGVVLSEEAGFAGRIKAIVSDHGEEYAEVLSGHLARHLAVFGA